MGGPMMEANSAGPFGSTWGQDFNMPSKSQLIPTILKTHQLTCTVTVFDLRAHTKFNFASDFAKLGEEKWPLYKFDKEETHGDLTGHMCAVFFSISFWVRGQGQTSTVVENCPSFNLTAVGVLT